MNAHSACTHGAECMRVQCDGTRHFHLDFKRAPMVLVHEWVDGGCRVTTSMGCVMPAEAD